MKQATPSLRKGQQRLDKHNEHDKKEESLTSDLLVLPSTSTFALKDDKQEKLKKKARNFLDEKQKIKTRAQSLWAYIGINKNKSRLILDVALTRLIY
jgi:hypothetical protein